MTHQYAVIGPGMSGTTNDPGEVIAWLENNPAAIMLAGGPPYKLTFTEACLREIMESQK